MTNEHFIFTVPISSILPGKQMLSSSFVKCHLTMCAILISTMLKYDIH